MNAPAHRWLTDWAGAVAPGAPTDLDLPALAEALAAVADDEGEPDPDELELLGDVLLDLERTRAAWLAEAARDDRLRLAAVRLRALFRRATSDDGDAEALAEARRDAVRELLALAGALAEHRLRQAAWARSRREKRARVKHQALPAQLGEPEAAPAVEALEAEEAARGVAARLRDGLDDRAMAALHDLLVDGGSGTAGAVARRHGLSAPTLSRAKARLGQLAAEALRDVPEAARRPFWDALERALLDRAG
ncbi:MAG: hypothetical protein KF878_24520 [Planctomycetes bacterium]|nr:hypothetical protein [Planctomycetota bacterium]